MLSKETKTRIALNRYARLQRRQVNYLRKYFVNSLLIPMPVIAANGGMRPGLFERLGISGKQVFLSNYAIAYWPASMRDPDVFTGQFIRSQRDLTFCTFAVNMKTHMLHGLSVAGFSIDLVKRRKFDLRKRKPSGLDTSMYYQPYAIPLTPQGTQHAEQASQRTNQEEQATPLSVS